MGASDGGSSVILWSLGHTITGEVSSVGRGVVGDHDGPTERGRGTGVREDVVFLDL